MSNTITHKGVEYKVLFPDLFRPHTPAEAAEFDRSVREIGIVSPVMADPEHGIIDGANRMRKAEELGIACPIVVMKDLSRGEKKQIAEQLNTARRQISIKEMKDRREARLQEAYTMRLAGRSFRQIGDKLGISHTQAQADVEEMIERSGGKPQLDKVKGKDGAERPATAPDKSPKPPEVPADPDATDGAPVTPATATDRKGTPIPDNLRDVLADRWHIGVANVLDQTTRQAKTVLKWSKYLDSEVVKHLKSAAELIRAAAPDCVCEDCKGEGCAECNTSGYKAGGKK